MGVPSQQEHILAHPRMDIVPAKKFKAQINNALAFAKLHTRDTVLHTIAIATKCHSENVNSTFPQRHWKE